MDEEENLDVSGKVIVLPEDEKIEPVIDRHACTQATLSSS